MSLAPLLEQLDVTMRRFVDFCILCGCDYTGHISGVGPKTAFKLLSQHGTVEGVAAAVPPRRVHAAAESVGGVWGECGRCEQVHPSKLPPPEVSSSSRQWGGKWE